jgi:hypothetical protein
MRAAEQITDSPSRDNNDDGWRHYHNVTKLLAAQHIISETMPIVHTPTG